MTNTQVPLVLLVEAIQEHGMPAEIRDGAVWGEYAFTITDPATGGVTNGTEWELVGTTVTAVRDWLGY